MNNLKDNIFKGLSYSSRDYDSIMADLVALLRSGSLGSDWDNLSEADPLFIMMSLMAAHTDILNYMLDYRVLENYMSTAKERASLVRIANSAGYKIRSFRPAYAEFVFDPSANLVEPTSLQKMAQFKPTANNNRIGWVYVGENITLDANSAGTRLPFVQGAIQTLTFSLDQLAQMTKIFSTSQVAIGSNMAGIETSTMKIGDTVWTEVGSVLGRSAADRVYELNVDTLRTTYIKFPSDMYTVSPEYISNLNAVLTYIVTAGTDVTIQPSKIVHTTDPNLIFKKPETDPYFVLGSDPATPDEIREGYKMYLYSGDSLISLADIKNYILNTQKVVPNINKCLVIDSTLDTNFGQGDYLSFNPGEFGVYLLKQGNQKLRNSELEKLFNEISKKKPAATYIKVFNNVDPLPGEFTEGLVLPATTHLRISWDTLTEEDFRDLFIQSLKVPGINSGNNLLETTIEEDDLIYKICGIEVARIASPEGNFAFTSSYTNGDSNHAYVDIDTSSMIPVNRTVSEVSWTKEAPNKLYWRDTTVPAGTQPEQLIRKEIFVKLNVMPEEMLTPSVANPDYQAFKDLIANYINNKNIGEPLESFEIASLIINDPRFTKLYKSGITINLGYIGESPTDKLTPKYNEFLNISTDNIIKE